MPLEDAAPSRRPVSVVHVIGSLDRGGAETVALDLCRAIPAERVRQVFVCASGRRGALAPQFEAAGAEVRVYGRGGVLRTLVGLAADLRRERPDVLQSHLGMASALFLLPGRLYGVRRRIARMHSEGDGRADTWCRQAYRALARRLMAAVATDVLAVSPGALAFALGDGRPARAPYGVLPNGIDLERFRGPAERGGREVVVLHVGRPDPAKNRAFLPPLARALAELTPSRVWVVGGGTEVDLPGEHPGIDDLGARRDVPELLRRADVLVLPSVREGLPTVALEALASGVPVVASDIGAATSLAAQLPGVRVLSLDDPVDAWARAVVDAARLPAAERCELQRSLDASPFDLRTNALRWQDVWGVGW
ncbi:glycosyltransferase family 1 protein [Nocardioides ginsengisoli]|uniref:Glycosyltransferase n=1 Tax=Nocardioides ginsengisoli TaxID=363868 RepID=A0ABW3W620_9ACTN